MISNKFSFARMWALTKRSVLENRRNILITVSVLFGILLLFSILLTKAFDVENSLHGSERGAILWVLYAWFSGIIVQIFGSLTFSNMANKQKRITNLMLPAAQSEKFVSQCLIYVVGGNFALIISLMLADTISSVMFGFIPGWCCLPKILDFRDIITDMRYGYNFIAICTMTFLWLFLFAQAIYVLGSTWWPRKSFLKTFIALLALQIIIPIIIPWGALSNLAEGFIKWFDANEIQAATGIAMIWCVLIMAYTMIIGIYYLAWRRYKSLEVVKRFLN